VPSLRESWLREGYDYEALLGIAVYYVLKGEPTAT
jgi:hypothetical protein